MIRCRLAQKGFQKVLENAGLSREAPEIEGKGLESGGEMLETGGEGSEHPGNMP